MPFLEELEADLAQHADSRGKLDLILAKLGDEAEDFIAALDERTADGRYRYGAERIAKVLKQHHGLTVAPTSIRNWRQKRL